MKRIVITLYICLTGILITSTFTEYVYGTDFVEKYIYHSLWFCSVWGAIAVMTLAVLIRRALWRRFPLLLLHGSLLIILLGAMLTFVEGKKGYIHLRPGITENSFQETPGTGEVIELPFDIRLDSFRIEFYPGTETPSDYVSYITCSRPGQKTSSSHQRISMNRIFSSQGFRFYQSSFDEDGQGSWLAVNYDPWGTGVTYTGYLLLGISMIWLLLCRQEEFRTLLRHPLLKKGGLFTVFFLSLTGTAQAQEPPLPVLKRVQADSLSRKQVIYHDRVAPFNTLARDFILKLTGKDSYKNLTPEQVTGGWLLCPEAWQNEPMIYIKSGELRQLLGLKTKYARLSDLFDGPVYRLHKYGQQSQGQSKLAKAIRETDEKVGLILMLTKGTLIQPLPGDGSVKSLPESKIRAELLYNRIPFTRILFMFNLTLGVLAFLRLLYRCLKRYSSTAGKRERIQMATLLLSVALYASFLFHLTGYCLRWYIGGRIPLSNGYETMQFMALCILLLASLLHRRFPFALPFGFLLSGFVLLVSYLGQMNPQITPLMPVLVSPWLSIHVSLIMTSYSLLAFIMLNGILALCLPGIYRKRMNNKQGMDNQTTSPEVSGVDDKRLEQLALLSRLLLYPATFFLAAGLFIGAIWANVSWGRYWAWDPKEVWALITLLIYSMAFHAQSMPIFKKPVFFHLFMVAAFTTVLMTYFGVNYFLGGMHSYANS